MVFTIITLTESYLKVAGALSSSPLCLGEGLGDSWPCSSWSTFFSSSPVPSSKGEPPLLPLLSPLGLDPLSDKTSEDGDVPCQKKTLHKLLSPLSDKALMQSMIYTNKILTLKKNTIKKHPQIVTLDLLTVEWFKELLRPCAYCWGKHFAWQKTFDFLLLIQGSLSLGKSDLYTLGSGLPCARLIVLIKTSVLKKCIL